MEDVLWETEFVLRLGLVRGTSCKWETVSVLGQFKYFELLIEFEQISRKGFEIIPAESEASQVSHFIENVGRQSLKLIAVEYESLQSQLGVEGAWLEG